MINNLKGELRVFPHKKSKGGVFYSTTLVSSKVNENTKDEKWLNFNVYVDFAKDCEPNDVQNHKKYFDISMSNGWLSVFDEDGVVRIKLFVKSCKFFE